MINYFQNATPKDLFDLASEIPLVNYYMREWNRGVLSWEKTLLMIAVSLGARNVQINKEWDERIQKNQFPQPLIIKNIEELDKNFLFSMGIADNKMTILDLVAKINNLPTESKEKRIVDILPNLISVDVETKNK